MRRLFFLTIVALLPVLAVSGGCGDDPTGAVVPTASRDTGGGSRDAGGSRDTGGGSDAGVATDGPIQIDLGGGDAVADSGAADSGISDTTATDTTVTDTTPVDVPPSGPFGTVSGTVWAPGNAPGSVPSGQEIPVAGALVYLATARPGAIPTHAYCASCVSMPSRAVLTDARGNFTLTNFRSGRYWLVMEKGQFRREVEVDVPEEATLTVDAATTTLPSVNDPTGGMTTPRIALAAGSYDHLEDILGKMGLGSVNTSGIFVPESADGVFDVWGNGGSSGAELGSLRDLVSNLDRMLEYHIIFIPCSGDSNTSALSDQANLRNLRDYVAAGGNLYVTDWSGEWADNVFPEQLQLGDGIGGFLGGGNDTPASAYDRARDRWNTSQFGSADGDAYDSPNAEAADADLAAWLNGQVGPTADSDRPETYNAASFHVEGNWNTIEATVAVTLGTGDDGEPIVDTLHVWVRGGQEFAPTPKKPLTVSYEPAGCGRVVYSTYHTTDDRHVGLAPQERILLYLIMEIGTCRNPKQ